MKQLDRGPYSRLTFSDHDRRPAWSADGKAIAFIRDTGATGGVFERPADGTGSARLIARLGVRVQEAYWTTNGKWLMLRTDNAGPGAGDILGMRSQADTTPVPFVATPFMELNPAVSPNGRWMAYVSKETGTAQVYVRPFPNTSGGRWQVSLDGGRNPVWARDGRSLYFIRKDGLLVEARLDRGATFAIGARQTLFDASRFQTTPYHQGFDVEPGDSTFLFIESTQPGGGGTNGARNIVVWGNHWFTDLKQRLNR